MHLQAQEHQTANKHQKLGRGQEGFPMAFRGGVALPPAGFQTPGLSNCETAHFRSLKPPNVWDFVKTALGEEHTCHPPKKGTALWYRWLKGCPMGWAGGAATP